MKINLLLLFFVYSISSFSQSDISYFKDSNNSLSNNTINKVQFNVLTNDVLERKTDATFWFKIDQNKSTLNYVFRINNIFAKNVKAYQNFKEIQPLKNQRFVSFKFSREQPVYVKVNSNYRAYFPVELETEETFYFKEKLNILINGFYYGVAFLVILFSINYYYFFKDISFLYHGFLLMSLTLIFLLSDGFLNFIKMSFTSIEAIMLLNYLFLTFFISKFTNSFLQLDVYYPKLKKYTTFIGISIFLLVVAFFIFKNNNLFILLNILTFLLLFIYWFMGLFLFNKAIHIKLFTFAYVIILFSGLDFFVLKNLEISVFKSSTAVMKIGGLVQIIVLSFAVLFREKNLRSTNFFMKQEIKKFSKIIEEYSVSTVAINKEVLSIRENEIFDLIVLGKANKEIAFLLNISVNTVKFHIKNIYEKLDIKSRKEAISLDKASV